MSSEDYVRVGGCALRGERGFVGFVEEGSWVKWRDDGGGFVVKIMIVDGSG